MVRKRKLPDDKRLLVSLTVAEFRNILEESILHYALKDKNSMTVDECVRFTGFSKSLIYKLTSNREIPFMRRGRRLVFYRNRIIEWLEKIDNRSTEKYNSIKKEDRKHVPYFEYINKKSEFTEGNEN